MTQHLNFTKVLLNW